MANEGSTKPTYSELETENLRVRGLLQRYGKHEIGCRWHTPPNHWLEDEIPWKAETECSCGLLATFPQSSSLVSQGAESADIGKLDTADKSGENFRAELHTKHGLIVVEAEQKLAQAAIGIIASRMEWLGSAETGGEKAAPVYFLCASCGTPADNPTKYCSACGRTGKFVKSGPDSREPEKLNNADRWTPELRLFHKLWGKAVGTSDYVKSDWQKLEHELFIKPALAESSLSSPPQTWPCPNCGKPLYDSGDHGIIHVNQADQCASPEPDK